MSHRNLRVLLEVCAESLDYAVAAQRGGADRIELCVGLGVGGITPSAAMMEAARKALRVPIHVLIRPRAGDFVYGPPEFETMRNDVFLAKQLKMDGIVTGVLDSETNIDVRRTRELIELARPLKATFHRAFDECRNFDRALEQAIETGADRVLTCGSRTQSAVDGVACLSRLVKAAAGRIIVMPGGGIRASNVAQIVEATAAREVHSSVGALEGSSSGANQGATIVAFERRVRELTSLLSKLEPDCSPDA